MYALPIAALPEFPDNEQLPVGTSRGRQPDLQNIRMETVDFTCENVPVNRTLGTFRCPFPLAQRGARSVDDEFNITNNP
jgi:hypothetical protein